VYLPSSRAAAIHQARAQLARQPIYLDTETTGLGDGDQIVEICILDDEGKILIDSLVRPTGGIPSDVVRIHGITTEMVRDKPPWSEIWPAARAALDGRSVAIYNADFDLRMMRQSHRRYGLEWNVAEDAFFCLMKLYAQFYGEWSSRYGGYRWHSLEAAALQCGIPLPSHVHRAREDAELARALLHHIAGA
jgi:DNA polymerase III subunit epsilon